MTQQEQQQQVSVDAGFQYQPIPVPNKADVKHARLGEIKSTIESKLQQLIAEASHIRQQINASKTDYKRKYFEKKFSKVNKSVRESVLALQQIQYLMSTQSDGGEDVATSNEAATSN